MEHSAVAFWEQGGLLHSTFKLRTFNTNCQNSSGFGFFFSIWFANTMLDILGLYSVDVTRCVPEDTVQRNSELGKRDFGVITGVSKKEQC